MLSDVCASLLRQLMSTVKISTPITAHPLSKCVEMNSPPRPKTSLSMRRSGSPEKDNRNIVKNVHTSQGIRPPRPGSKGGMNLSASRPSTAFSSAPPMSMTEINAMKKMGTIVRLWEKGKLGQLNEGVINDFADDLCFDDLMLTEEEVEDLYIAKCEDQHLEPDEIRAARFRDFLVQASKGTRFSLKQAHLGPVCAKVVADTFGVNEFYTVLSLSGNRFRDGGAKYLAEMLKTNDTLVQLELQSCDIGSDGGIELLQALLQNETLISLDLSALSGVNRNHIGVRGCRVLNEVLKKNIVLTVLSLGTNGIGPEGLLEIQEGLSTNTNITELDLSANSLGIEGMKLLVPHLRKSSITKLNLDRNHLGDRSVRLFTSALKGFRYPLRQLSLRRNNIRGSGFSRIGSFLDGDRHLSILDMSENILLESHVSALCEGLAQNKGLTKLYLSYCFITDEAGYHIGLAVKENESLTVLDFSNNMLGEKAGVQMGTILRNNKKLLHFCLSNNKLADEAGAAIASALKVNNTLRRLDLRYNHIKLAGASLAEALSGSNKTILEGEFSYNQMPYRYVASMKESLRRNRAAHVATWHKRLEWKISTLRKDESRLFDTERKLNFEGKAKEDVLHAVEVAKEELERVKREDQEFGRVAENEIATASKRRSKVEDTIKQCNDKIANMKLDKETRLSLLEVRRDSEVKRKGILTKMMRKKSAKLKSLYEAQERELAPLVAELEKEKQLLDNAKRILQLEQSSFDDYLKKFDIDEEKLYQKKAEIENQKKTDNESEARAEKKGESEPVAGKRQIKGKTRRSSAAKTKKK